MNGRGLEGLPDALTAEYSTILPAEDLGFAFSQEAETQEGSVSLAADSGGFTVRNSNDLAAGLKRIADETRAYYLIGYNPTNTARDGAYRKIEVKVRGPPAGSRSAPARGTTPPPITRRRPPPRPGTDPVFQAALDSPYELEDVPLRMTHFVREETTLDEARVFLAAEVDIRRLGFQEKDGQSLGALQYLMVAVQREGGEFFRFDQTLDLALPARGARAALPHLAAHRPRATSWRRALPGQDGRARQGHRTHGDARSTTSRCPTSRPSGSPPRSSATCARALRTAPRATGWRSWPAATSRRGGSLFCQLDVYRAVKEESSGMPRVSMSYEVRRSDGTLLTRDAPSLIRPTPEGALSRMIGFSLEDASPGEYELVLRFKDEFSGSRLELREPFRVSAPRPRRRRPAEGDGDPATTPKPGPAGLRRGAAAGLHGVSRVGPAPEAEPGTTLHAARASAPITLDGRLDEPDWQAAPVASGFLQRDPDQGQPATEPTELRLLFDDHALYVGARLHDREPERIVRQLSRRDALAEADTFTLYLDPHRDRRTGVVLQVSAAGVQRDAAIYDDNFEDDTWDAVWESAVAIDGGRLERRDAGPLLAAPLPDDPRPRLGRERAPRRAPQERELVARPRAEERERPRLAHDGARGHRRDRARAAPRAPALRVGPRRVRRTRDGRRTPGTTARALYGGAGLDFKYGVGSGMALVGAVNPDFGQVEVDPAVVNLTAFETFFEEKRPFFTEGSQVFLRFGRSGASEYTTYFYPEPQLFYSRRIGRVPQGRAAGEFVDTPDRPPPSWARPSSSAARRAAGTSACWRR